MMFSRALIAVIIQIVMCYFISPKTIAEEINAQELLYFQCFVPEE